MNTLIIFGLVGGALPDVLRIIKGKYEQMPGYFKNGMFYFGLLLQIAVGGFVIYLLKPTNELQAVLMGYAAPSILTNLASKFEQQEDVKKGASREEFALLGWWR